VEYKWDRVTDEWRVAILDTMAYGRVALMDIALATSVADHFHFASEVRPVRIGVWHRTAVVDLHDNE
jgi:hypothetical protein